MGDWVVFLALLLVCVSQIRNALPPICRTACGGHKVAPSDAKSALRKRFPMAHSMENRHSPAKSVSTLVTATPLSTLPAPQLRSSTLRSRSMRGRSTCRQRKAQRKMSTNTIRVSLPTDLVICALAWRKTRWIRRRWRAPGYAPVADPCGIAGGEHPHQGIGGDSVFYKRTVNGQTADYGDKGSLLPPSALRPKWKRGTQVEVAWGPRYNHGGGYSYRLCSADNELTEECFQKTPLAFDKTKQVRPCAQLSHRHMDGCVVDCHI
eukprot:SAG31_NODE_716_length_12626_cov_7.493973_7_plen_264_part_00